MSIINARALVGTHDVLFMTLDTLRYDVAVECLAAGRTPSLAGVLPDGRWERRHSPGSFTYAAHQAFFAGFLPTPADPEALRASVREGRLFASRFAGSETTSERTAVFDTPDIVSGFASRGYHTVCIGGVGFFNKLTPLGCVLPGLFAESHWDASMSVTDPRSAENQFQRASQILSRMPAGKRIFLFINVSAIHQPNHFYLPGSAVDSLASHAAALAYVDQHVGVLFRALRRRGSSLCVICSDHGTCYGEDGFHGHRLAHPAVWTVPYAEFVLM